ncbi:MAG: phosphate ABC transporter substrate-binding protein [Magnetococcus sp. DMHC-1]|nr:phosphate ABC transporter substrate-binding protein [Magnetococcales bacterium]
MNRWGMILLLAVASWSIQAWSAEELQWTGCGITKTAFMSELAQAFEQKTGQKIVLTGGGAARGIRAVAASSAHLGGTCRARLQDATHSILPEEQNARLIQVAWDALVVIVHPSNPVNNISLDNLKKIYLGEIDSWDTLGGEAKKIALIDREGKESGVGNMFRRLVFNDPNFDYRARSLKVKSSNPVEQKVESFSTAMAIDGVSSARKLGVKILELDGVAPTRDNIRTARYALYRPLYMVVNRQKISPQTQAFIDYALSDAGQEIIAAQGVVNLKDGDDLAKIWHSRFGDQEP